MQNHKKIHKNEEKSLKENEYEWLYIYSGKRADLIRLASMLMLNPGVVILFVYYISGIELNFFLTYLLVDALILLWWWLEATKNKNWLEAAESEEEQKAILRRKIEELKAIEEEKRQS